MKSYLQNKITGDASFVLHAIYQRNLPFLLLCFFFSSNIVLMAQPEIALESIASGFVRPLDVLHAGDARLFVVEQDGKIKVIDENGTTLNTPFLNITSQVNSNGNEQGLLGMAFHPNYTENGYFFIHYSKNNGDTRIARYTISADNANVADPDSEFVILEVDQPYSNHNGGCIKFGPDGYLYIGLGDGGSGGDPQKNGQNRLTMLGKMLRIDVDNGDPYGIPTDNPFAEEDSTLDEIWAIGLRNPWRFSFDRLTGDLWMGDVGQNEWEEIDFQSVDSPGGENYGWRCYEALEPFDNDPNDCPDESELIFPVAIYGNTFTSGCSITGGYVYRGALSPTMYGYYFYVDYCSGRFWAMIRENDEWVATEILNDSNFDFSSFGEGVDGELYVTGLSSGNIYHIVADCPEFIISATLQNETCEGDADGSIGVILEENMDFSVVWSTGETTDTIYNLSSGDYTVTLSDENGCSYTKPFIITNSTPDAPVILLDGLTVSVNDSYETYQWYLDDLLISGANAGSYAVVSPGMYSVEVTNAAGCSVFSEAVQVDVLGLEALGLTRFSIHPNPFIESINISIDAKEAGNYIIRLQSLDGKVIYEQEAYINALFRKNIDFKNVNAGTYLLILEKNQQQLMKKIIKQ